MREKPIILAGLVIFLALATFPIWYTLGFAAYFSTDVAPPDLEPPAGALKFSADLSAEEVDLDALRGEFRKHEIPSLSSEAVLTRDEPAGAWRIVDGPDDLENQRRYLVLEDEDQKVVNVYDGCVQEKVSMRAEHMSLLLEWREGVVREGDRSCIEINGQEYPKSLTGACLTCHTDHQTFCYRCHEYANALPAWPARDSTTSQPGIRCWNCHVEPERK